MKVAVTVLGLMLVGFGAIMRLNVGQSLSYTRAQQGWQTTEATITRLWVLVDNHPKSNTTLYHATFDHTYLVDGKTHKGTARFGSGHEEKADAEADLKGSTYTEGAKVTVHYNPSSPDQNAFQPGTHDAMMERLLKVGTGFIVAGGCVFLLGLVLLVVWRGPAESPR